MNTFQQRLKYGEEAEDVFEEMLKQQIFPNKGYERLRFETLRDKHGWNVTECQKYTRINGDFRVVGENWLDLYFDVKGTEKISETSLSEARKDLIFAMNFHVSREHCFFLRKEDTAAIIRSVSKKIKLPSGDDGYSIFAAQDCPQHRMYIELPRKVLSLKKRIVKANEELSNFF
mgnify:CR=1 FL=1